jgi:hypothetical protein
MRPLLLQTPTIYTAVKYKFKLLMMRCKEAAAHGTMVYAAVRMADKSVAMAAIAQHAGAIDMPSELQKKP